MTEIMKVREAVLQSAQTNSSPCTRVVNKEEQLPIGKVARQGDVYLQRMELPADYPRVSDHGPQIAPGETQGSRHVVTAKADIVIRAPDGGNPLEGPTIYAPTGFHVEHPEHGNMQIDLPGCYKVTFPRDLNQEEIERIRD